MFSVAFVRSTSGTASCFLSSRAAAIACSQSCRDDRDLAGHGLAKALAKSTLVEMSRPAPLSVSVTVQWRHLCDTSVP